MVNSVSRREQRRAKEIELSNRREALCKNLENVPLSHFTVGDFVSLYKLTVLHSGIWVQVTEEDVVRLEKVLENWKK